MELSITTAGPDRSPALPASGQIAVPPQAGHGGQRGPPAVSLHETTQRFFVVAFFVDSPDATMASANRSSSISMFVCMTRLYTLLVAVRRRV